MRQEQKKKKKEDDDSETKDYTFFLQTASE
jgi:hypothetical protein